MTLREWHSLKTWCNEYSKILHRIFTVLVAIASYIDKSSILNTLASMLISIRILFFIL